MRIITYSDLHLEFGSGWMLPPAVHEDVMILAGDIVTLRDYEPLDQILRKWKKPVLYVTGNHEYYTRRPMNEEDNRFKAWLEDRHPHVKLLLDEEVSIGGVNFFGGTMWTDFNGGDLRAMETARSQMNDYRLIYNSDQTLFTPADSITLHENFASKLLNWFGKNLSGPRVVISHNAPVINPKSKYKGGPLTPAFNSLDMVEIIETHQPALWGGTISRARSYKPCARGVYDLKLSNPDNAGSGLCATCVPASTKRTQFALLIIASTKGINRYSISLPPGGVFEEPSGDDYSEEASITDYFQPPDKPFPDQPKTYPKDVKVHYKVSDLNVELSGTPDNEPWPGPFKTTGPIKFSVEPPQDVNYYCDYHARMAFMDMNDLFKSGKFVDSPQYWGECRDKWDPQKSYQPLPNFEARQAPDPRAIDIRSIIDIITSLRGTARELLPGDGATQETLTDVEEYVEKRPWENPKRGKELGKHLKAIVEKVERLPNKNDKVFNAKKVLFEREIDLLGPIVIFSGTSGRNCKAPMMNVTLQ